jgi:hypothetical protein
MGKGVMDGIYFPPALPSLPSIKLPSLSSIGWKLLKPSNLKASLKEFSSGINSDTDKLINDGGDIKVDKNQFLIS